MKYTFFSHCTKLSFTVFLANSVAHLTTFEVFNTAVVGIEEYSITKWWLKVAAKFT
jgi:hypothetical protein